ncbi:MAG TPA: hypothetical protein VM711_08250 [Sphingomicrobium sp.]|nr:hypothetical protein [Sphingomicrobium sp.]
MDFVGAAVVIDVDVEPLVLVVFALVFELDDGDVVFVVCANAGVATNAIAATDAINFFIASSSSKNAPAVRG